MMKKHGLRRFFSLLLAVFMVCTLLPTAALAEDTTGADETQSKTVVVDEKKPEPPAQEQPKGENPPAPEEPKQKEVQQPEGETPEETKQKDGKQPEGETPEETKQDGGKQSEGEDPAKVETPANENTPVAPAGVSKSPAVGTYAKKSIPITVKVHDGHTDKDYELTTVRAEQGSGLGSGFLYYKLPDLSSFVAANTFGSISKVKKGSNIANPEWITWKVGKDVVWSVVADSGYITYYVDRYTPASDTDDTRWLKSFKLTYDGNGDGAASVPQAQAYRTNNSGETTHNFTISSTVPTRSGYIFKGWSTTANGSVAHRPDGSIAVTGSTTLFAVWEENTYTVTYTDGVDGEEVFANQEVSGLKKGDATPDFEGGTPTRDGYTFVRWNPAVTATVTGDAIYTAVWEEEKYTVTYTDGVDGVEVFEDVVRGNLPYGTQTPAFHAKDPFRRGYVFTGWNPTVAAIVTGDATYTAVWEEDANGNGIPDKEEEKYTVTYTDGVENEEIFANQVYSNLLPDTATPAFNGTPTRAGYKFLDWEPTVAETVTGNATYVAQWEKLYTVTYTDGVKGEEVFEDVVHNDIPYGTNTPAFGTKDPTRKGYKFLGWEPGVADTVTEDVTYTAQWKPVAPTYKELPEISVIVDCGTTTEHKDATWLLLENTYEVGKVELKNDVYTCILTVKAGKYVDAYNSATMGVGEHELNDDSTKDIVLTWKDGKWTAEKSSVTFKVKCKLYTVTYEDGAKGKAFKTQEYTDLAYGSATPKFNGTPKRSGYTFTGWSPKVTDTVTKDVTYTATWKANSGKDYVPKTGDGQIVMILGSVLLFSFCGAAAVSVYDRKRKQG